MTSRDGARDYTPEGTLPAQSTPTTGSLGSNGKLPAVGLVHSIAIDGGKTLTLDSSELVLEDPSAKKRNRTCCFGASPLPPSQRIPLYNVLWAEFVGHTLTIDFAEYVTKTKLRAAKWTFSLPDEAVANLPGWIDALITRAYGPAKMQRRAKVLVNPHAGPGGAEKSWEKEVKPLFDAARMHLDVVQTRYSGEAVELAQQIDIDAFDTIVACSGDGLPYEIFNGLGKRPDARRALQKIAVSHIPCGSGNAMSCNLYGTHRVSLAALAIIKGVDTPMDLVSVTQGDTRTLSFLSQSLGIVAESDLATEHLRWMGQARFTYGFLVRIFEKMCYPCDLAVKVEIAEKDEVKEHYARVRGDGTLSDTSIEGLKPETLIAGDSSLSFAGDEGLPELRYGTVNDELPDGWELIPHDKMGNFYCGNMAFMAADANFFSAACIADGYMDLVCINGDVSPLTSINLLLSVENGKFFDHPLVSYRKISGYRIIPRDQKDGYISIDGERVPFEPFQAEVHPGLGLVISKFGRYEAPGPKGWRR